MLGGLQASDLFQLTCYFLLFAGVEAFLDVHSPRASFLIGDEFLPDKRSSYLPRLPLLLLFIAHLKSSLSPMLALLFQEQQSYSHCSRKRDRVSG